MAKKSGSGWACMECGRKFATVAAAERASLNGCPKCDGTDIDLDEPHDEKAAENAYKSRVHHMVSALMMDDFDALLALTPGLK